MTQTVSNIVHRTASDTVVYSWTKVLLWALLFYLVWNWKGMLLVINEGVLPGPDDYLRLSQVQNWLAGQGWYDVRAYNIFPPSGADIHWTRFVDAPIGLLVGFFKLFIDATLAQRVVGILWPLALFLAALSAMVALCDRLAGKEHRLLVLFFFVMSMSTLAEFKPGRFDHHNIQILLLVLIMLGIVGGLGRFSNYFIGLFATLSIVVGLDSLLLIMSLLGFLALEWTFKREGSATRLLQSGTAMAVSGLVFYAASFSPQRWFENNACDAFSMLYLLALLLLSATFILLSTLSQAKLFSGDKAILNRFVIGGVLGVIIVSTLFILFPHCLDGPYGNVGPELKARWLDNITEAKGLIASFSTNPPRWIAQGFYLAIMLTIMAVVVYKKRVSQPELLIVGFIVLVSIAGSFHQNRVLRTGLYAVIPFCVIFVVMLGEWLSKRMPEKQVLALGGKAIICVLLTSTFWFVMGALGGMNTVQGASTTAHMKTGTDLPIIACTSDISVAELNRESQGHIMADLNTATSLLVHTDHSVEAGSYHRNGESILNVLSFFGGTSDEARQIARTRNVDYVVICREDISAIADQANLTLAERINTNQLPQWLTWISKPNAPLAVLKVVR